MLDQLVWSACMYLYPKCRAVSRSRTAKGAQARRWLFEQWKPFVIQEVCPVYVVPGKNRRDVGLRQPLAPLLFVIAFGPAKYEIGDMAEGRMADIVHQRGGLFAN